MSLVYDVEEVDGRIGALNGREHCTAADTVIRSCAS